MLKHLLNICSSTAVSTLTGWKGTAASKSVALPEKDLILFDRENCEECRLVRQVLTELNLNVLIKPCPEQGDRHKDELVAMSGADQIPYLNDPNTDLGRVGADSIIDYLYQTYSQKNVPQHYLQSPGFFDPLVKQAIKQLRSGKGRAARPSRQPEKTLMLYSFESSPFSRPVRELLCELEISYNLVNLGKQQRADMGPAVQRCHLGPYVPVKGSKREDFLRKYQEVMVPFLVDPNTGKELFQSKDILAYLEQQYAL